MTGESCFARRIIGTPTSSRSTRMTPLPNSRSRRSVHTSTSSRFSSEIIPRNGRAEKISWRSRPQARRSTSIHIFIEDSHCSVCEVMPPLASAAGREHRFRVFLPPGYHENTLKKYPVLYMHVGQNLFLREEAFVGNTWRIDEVLGMLDRMNAIEEVIVVGIYPDERARTS